MEEADLEEIPLEPTGAPTDEDLETLDPEPIQGQAPAKARKVVEAALFSAGGPLSEEEIVEATGLPEDEIREALEELVSSYDERPTALEVARAGEKYAMQIQADLADQTRDLAPTEIPKHLLRTLALIAYHQPLRQSELVDMIGSKTYTHVRELQEIGMIDAEPDGLTKELTTTEAFPEYFGIDATDPDDIRQWLAGKVGIEEVQPASEPAQAAGQTGEPTGDPTPPDEGPSGPESPMDAVHDE